MRKGSKIISKRTNRVTAVAKGVSEMKSPEPERLNQPSARLLWGGSAGAPPAIPSPGVLFSRVEGGVCVGEEGPALCAKAAVVQNSSKKSRNDIRAFIERLEDLSTIIFLPLTLSAFTNPSGIPEKLCLKECEHS